MYLASFVVCLETIVARWPQNHRLFASRNLRLFASRPSFVCLGEMIYFFNIHHRGMNKD